MLLQQLKCFHQLHSWCTVESNSIQFYLWDSLPSSGSVYTCMFMVVVCVLAVLYEGAKYLADTNGDIFIIIPPHNEVVGGYIGFPPSVHPSVSPASSVRSVASTVPDGLFQYLVQMINSMRGCVACGDFFTLTSRLFGLDLENRVRSVASTVLDGLFLYLAQMITIIRGCVAHYVWSESGILNFWNFFL